MFKKSTLHCFAVLIVGLAGLARAELLINPGFEDDTPLTDTWKAWGGGDGQGGWWENYHATVKEDGTAHGGNKYVEGGLADPGWSSWSWNGMWVWQEHPVTEGNAYRISGWLRDGDADGTPSLIADGAGASLEWRDSAPVGGPTGQRGNELSRDTQLFDLTHEWTYVTITAIAPAGALGVSAGFFTGVGINLDIDDASFVDLGPPPLISNGSFEEDEAIQDDPDWSGWVTWNPAEGAGSNATIVNTDAVDGARSLRIDPLGGTNWYFVVLHANIQLEVGTNYTTTFWAKAAVPRPLDVGLKAMDNSVTWSEGRFDLTTDWVEYSVSGVAENPLAKLEFLCAETTDTIWLDLVSIVEPPILANGSFEKDEPILDDPDWLGWCTWNPPEGAGSTVTIVDTDSTDGAKSLMIEPKGTEGWHFILLNTPLSLEVGREYVTTFWAKAAVPRPFHIETKATDNSVTWGRADFDLTTDWAEYSASSIAQNATAKLEFHCSATNDALWLDFVSVVEVEVDDGTVGPSLLANGSFEEDEPIQDDPDWVQWTTWNPAEGAGSNAAVDDTDFVDGARSLRIDPRGGTNWYFVVLYADIALEVGREYTIDFWAKAATPRPINVQLKAMDNSVTWSQGQFNLTTDWVEYSVSGVAANASAKLEFLCATTNDTIWLDSVSLYAEGAGPSGPVNLALNGSFEEDEPILDDDTWEAWCTWYPSDVVGNNVMIVDTDAIDGARSLQVEPKGTLIVANISFPLTVGSNATATFWAKAQSARPLSAGFKADDNSVTWGDKSFQLTTEWAEYSMTSAAQSNLGKLEFSCGDSEVRFWLDAVTVTAEQEPAPLVTNGSFEDDFTGWWTWNPAEGGGTWTVIETQSIDGDKSLRIDGLGTENWHYMVINTIPLEVGTTYTASLWAKAEEPRSISVKLKANDNSVEWGNTDFQLTTEWAEYYFTAEAQNALGKFEIHCGTSIPVYLDFVSVYEGEYDPGVAPAGTPNARGLAPAHGAADVPRDITLAWVPGNSAVTHDVYFGTNFDDVDAADITDTTGIYRGSLDLATASYTPAESPLDWDQTYYWRIDEINDADPNSPWKGSVWSFTVTNHVVVDDFESYNDIELGQDGSNLVYMAWADGYENPANGSTIGYTVAFEPTMETQIVHGGHQSAPLAYDNSSAGISEITKTLNADWTQDGVLTLVVFYKGKLTNDPVPMYIALNGTAITNPNPKAAKASGWTPWPILLQDFAALGVDLANITTMTIGFGNPATPIAGGSGSVLIDDIRLSRALPAESEQLPEPADPGTANLVASYSFENDVQDTSGHGRNGTIMGNPFFVDGIVGKALAFDGVNDYVNLGNNAAFDITDQITISAWVNPNDAGDGQHNPYVGKGDHAYALKHASSNSIEFFIYDNGWYTANVSVDSSFNGEWHHVLGTYDGSEVKTYVDGILGATNPHQGSIEVQTHNLTMAINSEVIDRYYYGMIDEVKIYNRALSDGEIRFIAGY